MNANKGVWCVGEIRNGKLTPALAELVTAGKRIAQARGEALTAVVVGAPGSGELAKAAGADKVVSLEHASFSHFIDEAHARALLEVARKDAPAVILLPGSIWGRSVAARLAVGLKGAALSGATDVAAEGAGLTVTRSGYGGGAVATVEVKAFPAVITVQPMAFARSAPGAAAVSAVAMDPSSWGLKTEFVSFSPEQSGEIDLSSAEKIVSGGRGLGDAKGFELVRSLAQALGGAVGASRAVVDAGWIPYKHQVGLTGRSVRPRLYVACGISGQIQHLAGMNGSQIIVAINTDASCPMMKLATYAVEGDVYKIVPAVVAEIAKVRGQVPAGAR